MIKPADIPEYIKKHSSRTREGHLKIEFPRGRLKNEEDTKEQLGAKRWLRSHGGYFVRCFWILPMS